MTVMETTTCFGLYWPSSGCLGSLSASYMLVLKFPRQPDDGHYRPKHVVVSITVIKYTSVIKLCLTTYISLVFISRLVSRLHQTIVSISGYMLQCQVVRPVHYEPEKIRKTPIMA